MYFNFVFYLFIFLFGICNMYVLFVSFSFWTPYHGCNLFVILFSLFEWRWWYCDRCKCNSFNIFCIQIPITIVSCRVYIFHSIVTQTLIVLLPFYVLNLSNKREHTIWLNDQTIRNMFPNLCSSFSPLALA